LIINYNHVWLHYPDLKQVHELTLKQSSGLSALFVGFGGSVANIQEQFTVQLLETGSWDGGGSYYKLALLPIPGTPAASPALGLDKVILTVNDSKWYPVRTMIVQKNGDSTVLEYHNQRDNLKLSDSRFTFNPPKGTQVIQHGDGVAN
jgi:outer membrane lipoprotein-sorting protein